VQEGKLSLGAKLSELMPELHVRDGADITLQHLLNHTSGMPDDVPLFGESGLWSGYAPGSHWSYCNTGYDIIGQIIARTDGRGFPQAVEARVLRPLGMNNSIGRIYVGDRDRFPQGYEPPFNDRISLRPGPMTHATWIDSDRGAGCVSSTAGDMALFLRYLLGLAQGHGGPVLSDAAAVQFLADPADAPGWAEGAKYGNGVARVTADGRTYLHHTGGMVSFCSALHVDPEAGIAAFASSNVGYPLNYRPRDVTKHACRLFKAARDGEAAPAPSPTRLSVEHPEQFAGTFTAANGSAFEIRADGDQVKMIHNDRETAMQQVGPPAFACADPDFAVSGLLFEAENDVVVRVWANDVEYLKDPAHGYKPAPSAELHALAGRYDNDDRWSGPLFIIARDGKLWLNNSDELKPLPDGSYRIGEDWSPERVRFDSVINGRPSRVLFSGAAFIRRFS
jgi:Beta-lactamase